MADRIDWDAMFANVKPQDDDEHIEHEKQTCQNCYHYKCCSDFGFVLDPLRGGVICDTFVSTADVAPVVHGRWERTPDGAAKCTACKRKMNPSQYGYAFCGLCGARMDGELYESYRVR